MLYYGVISDKKEDANRRSWERRIFRGNFNKRIYVEFMENPSL